MQSFEIQESGDFGICDDRKSKSANFDEAELEHISRMAGLLQHPGIVKPMSSSTQTNARSASFAVEQVSEKTNVSNYKKSKFTSKSTGVKMTNKYAHLNSFISFIR